MIERVGRLKDLFASRQQSYSDLFALQSLEETVAWGNRNRLLGFNRSAIRLRILYSLASAFHATHFIETGSYHGATSICAFRSLAMRVWTCEISRWNNWVTKAVVCGLGDIETVRADSRMFLQQAVSRLQKARDARPFFYLDAHAGTDARSCPILEEISLLDQLDAFLAVIDDFEVPRRSFGFGTYGNIALRLDFIRSPLLSSGIRRVFFPAYPPELEKGFARTGYVVFFRSSALDHCLQDPVFPLNLLQSCGLSDGRLSQSCVSS